MEENKLNALDELVNLHDEAVKAIAVGELYNETVYIALHNELRNTLSHVMEMIKVREDNDKYDEAYNNAFVAAGTDYKTGERPDHPAVKTRTLGQDKSGGGNVQGQGKNSCHQQHSWEKVEIGRFLRVQHNEQHQ